MKTFVCHTKSFLFLLTVLFFINPLVAQNDTMSAPLPIIDFDANSQYHWVDYPKEGEVVDYNVYEDSSDTKYIFNGNALYLEWKLKGGQYFGWIVDFTKEGFDTRGAKSLTFWILGKSVEEQKGFQIKIKDIDGKEQAVNSSKYIKELSDKWQKVCIPLKDFKNKVDLTRLWNVNLGFDKATEKMVKIYIDEFYFEFEKCNPKK